MINITKEAYKKAIDERRIVVTGARHTSANGWTAFRVYEVRDNKLYPIVCTESPYWSEKYRYYRCTAWGTNRVLEIFLSIGYVLKLNFHEMSPQVTDIL